MRKIQEGQWWPYLLTGQNQIWTCTTRPPGENPRQVLKKSDEWFGWRCDNGIVTVIAKIIKENSQIQQQGHIC